MSKDISRRQFFRLLPDRMFNPDKAAGQPVGQQAVCRPPGASKNERVFLDTCGKCQACSRACPFDAILHLGPSFGAEEGTPFMNVGENPCRWCEDMPCIAACPTDALRYNSENGIDPVAKVSLNMNACLNQQGILCDECAQVCPPGIKAIKMKFRKPQLDPEQCVGCGLCVFYCAATPSAIRSIPR